MDTLPLSPLDPLLFFPEGWDTRWWSVGDVLGRVAAGREALAALGLAPGATVAYAASHRPEALVADLAIRTAGLVPAPRAPQADGRLLLPGESVEQPGPAATLPSAPAQTAETALSVPATDVIYPSGEREDAATVAERVSALAVAFESPRGPRSRRRPIVLTVGDPGDPDRRAFVDAALRAGAALYLEYDAEFLAGSALWARPTMIAVRAGEERQLSTTLRRADARAVKRLLARLETLVLLGNARLGVDALAEWSERGVRVVAP